MSDVEIAGAEIKCVILALLRRYGAPIEVTYEEILKVVDETLLITRRRDDNNVITSWVFSSQQTMIQ